MSQRILKLINIYDTWGDFYPGTYPVPEHPVILPDLDCINATMGQCHEEEKGWEEKRWGDGKGGGVLQIFLSEDREVASSNMAVDYCYTTGQSSSHSLKGQ